MPQPDLAAAAKELGVTQDALMAALGRSMPPDTAAAAKKLGVTEAALLDALGIKGKP
jgi:lambda repressor-like predicted transcriptional regulator